MLLFCRIPFVKDGLVSTKQITDAEAAKHKSLKGIKILDVGCGGGILCEVSETIFDIALLCGRSRRDMAISPLFPPPTRFIYKENLFYSFMFHKLLSQSAVTCV